MSKLELMEQLLADVELMAYDDEDRFVDKTELYIKKCFGANSDYIHKLKNISFIPFMYTTNMPQSEYQEAFNIGKKELINLIKNMVEDLTLSVNDSISENKEPKYNGKVFVVHGHDSAVRDSVAVFLNSIGYKPIILCQEVNKGRTIIEKIEDFAEDVQYAVVLYTPCDLGRDKDKSDLTPRARQNVVFEHGYMCAKLGRDRVCAIYKEGVELPGDYSGVLYTEYDKNGAWKLSLAREMASLGLPVDILDIK